MFNQEEHDTPARVSVASVLLSCNNSLQSKMLPHLRAVACVSRRAATAVAARRARSAGGSAFAALKRSSTQHRALSSSTTGSGGGGGEPAFLDLGLSQELNHEITEEEDYEAPDELAELEASLDFTVDDETLPPGSLLVTLVRSTEAELVEVVFNAGDLVTPPPPEDMDGEEGKNGAAAVVIPCLLLRMIRMGCFLQHGHAVECELRTLIALGFVASVPFQVTVAKTSVEDRALKFECEATEDGDVHVHRIRVERDSDDDLEEQDEFMFDEDGETEGIVGEYDGPVFSDLEESLQDQFMEYLEVRLWRLPWPSPLCCPCGVALCTIVTFFGDTLSISRHVESMPTLRRTL